MPLSHPYLLSGAPGSGLSRRLGPLLLSVVLFLLLLGGGGYLLFTRYYRSTQTAQAQPVAAAALPAQLSDPLRNDLLLHVQNATGELEQNIESIRRAQQRLALVADALERYSLPLQRRRLAVAEQACEDAVWQANASLTELRVASEQLK